MSAEDELSDMEISDDDDNSGRMKHQDVGNDVDNDDDDDDKILSMIKEPPPPLSDVREEFDTSGACLVEIDGQKLKKNKISSLYRTLVNFSYHCRQKRILQYFSSPGQKEVDGGITSWEGNKLQRHKHCHRAATKVIAKYNRLTKDGKLKLEKLIKVNTIMGFAYYMTFSAIDKHTGKSGIYQAAFRCQGVDSYVLGLFRDWSNAKILAILSITGAEEDLADIRKTGKRLDNEHRVWQWRKLSKRS